MHVRCACFEGDVIASDRERFESIVRDEMVPRMLKFPGIRSLRLRWGRESETPERHIYLVIEHGYDSPEAIESAITSDVRASMSSALEALMGLFDGKVWHVNYELETLL